MDSITNELHKVGFGFITCKKEYRPLHHIDIVKEEIQIELYHENLSLSKPINIKNPKIYSPYMTCCMRSYKHKIYIHSVIHNSFYYDNAYNYDGVLYDAKILTRTYNACYYNMLSYIILCMQKGFLNLKKTIPDVLVRNVLKFLTG